MKKKPGPFMYIFKKNIYVTARSNIVDKDNTIS